MPLKHIADGGGGARARRPRRPATFSPLKRIVPAGLVEPRDFAGAARQARSWPDAEGPKQRPSPPRRRDLRPSHWSTKSAPPAARSMQSPGNAAHGCGVARCARSTSSSPSKSEGRPKIMRPAPRSECALGRTGGLSNKLVDARREHFGLCREIGARRSSAPRPNSPIVLRENEDGGGEKARAGRGGTATVTKRIERGGAHRRGDSPAAGRPRPRRRVRSGWNGEGQPKIEIMIRSPNPSKVKGERGGCPNGMEQSHSAGSAGPSAISNVEADHRRRQHQRPARSRGARRRSPSTPAPRTRPATRPAAVREGASSSTGGWTSARASISSSAIDEVHQAAGGGGKAGHAIPIDQRAFNSRSGLMNGDRLAGPLRNFMKRLRRRVRGRRSSAGSPADRSARAAWRATSQRESALFP